MKTLCTYYHQCNDADKCGRKVTQQQVGSLLLTGETVTLFPAPPVCHTEWKDRQDLYKENE